MANIRIEYPVSNDYFLPYIPVQEVKLIVMVYYHFIDYTVEQVDIGVSSNIIDKVNNWTILKTEIEAFARKAVEGKKVIEWPIEVEEYENGADKRERDEQLLNSYFEQEEMIND